MAAGIGREKEKEIIFDVLCTEPAHLSIDPDIFSFWIEGLSVSDAQHQKKEDAQILFKQQIHDDAEEQPSPFAMHRLNQCIIRDVRDQYRLLDILLPYFMEPNTMDEFCPLPLPAGKFEFMLGCYYAFQPLVVRKFLGKPIKANRREVDEVATETKTRKKGCKRQLDNIKNMFKCFVEDGEAKDEPLASAIVNRYHLPLDLAQKYAHILFLAKYRFETLRGNLSKCPYDDIDLFAKTILQFWTKGSDLDAEYFERLLAIKDSDHFWVASFAQRVLDYLKKPGTDGSDKDRRIRFNADFVKVLVNRILGTISQIRSIGSLFSSIEEKLVVHCQKLSSAEVLSLFKGVLGCLKEANRVDFARYLEVVSVVTHTLHRRLSYLYRQAKAL